MDDPDPNQVPVPAPDCWSPARLELLEWLRRTAPSLAELYEGTVQIICNIRIPGWTRLVCHAIREIGNRIPEVLIGERAGMLLHTNRVQDIRLLWERAGLPTDGSSPANQLTTATGQTAATDVQVPTDVYVKIAALIRDHVETWQSRRELAVKFFAKIAGQDRNTQKALRPLVDQWIEVVHWFVSHAHDNGQTDSEYDADEITAKFELFDATLRAVVRGFFSTTDELNEILDEANS